jgi:Superinfection immunity protein
MSGVPGGMVGAAILFALYFLPAIVAAWRRHPSANAITALHLFLGWPLIGWAAGADVVTLPRRDDQHTRHA